MSSTADVLPASIVWRVGVCVCNPVCVGFLGVWELDKQLLCVCMHG